MVELGLRREWALDELCGGVSTLMQPVQAWATDVKRR